MSKLLCAPLALMLWEMLPATTATAQTIRGVAPTYTTRAPAADANSAAILTRIWAPGLDDGYVPQGIAVLGDVAFVSGYRSVDQKVDRGPCRLFRIDMATGRTTATLDLPPTCGHAGGLALVDAQRLWVVDSHVLHEIALHVAAKPTLGRVLREIKIAEPVKGSLATVHRGALWLGSYERDAPGRLYAFPIAALAKQSRLTVKDAARTITLPSKAQGAAFDLQGRLWIARSGSRLGELAVIDPASGAPLATYRAPAGIEGLMFAPDGRLWTLSEAGSQRWNTWPTFFPLVFELAPDRLR